MKMHDDYFKRSLSSTQRRVTETKRKRLLYQLQQ